MIKSFPKIFAIGTKYIKDIFKEEVEITEKIDGSQFGFGKIDSKLFMRSKGQQIFQDNPDKMFLKAVEYVEKIQDKIPNNTVFYCEYLQKPKHNVLEYTRTPINNLILFGICNEEESFVDYKDITKWAKKLKIEAVPLIFQGNIKKADELFELIKTDSILGNCKVEGVVVKSYKPFMMGNIAFPIMCGKYVSEKFKEVHNKSWSKEKTARGRFEVFKDRFRTEARWEKAIQHLKEKGELENAPKDIGKLLKEIQQDIAKEEKENIKDFLYKEFAPEILRYSTAGFPEWYKEKLAKEFFNNKFL